MSAENSKAPLLATISTAVLTLVACGLLLQRTGVIPVLAALTGIALLVKIRFKPGPKDLALSIVLILATLTAWVGTLYYVISSYESGEVVELVVDTDTEPHVARVWIFEMAERPLVYYDAPPDIAAPLLAGSPVQLIRGEQSSTVIPQTRRADDLPVDEQNQVLGAMAAKYGDRMTAADIYYLLLGRPYDRVALVIDLGEPRSADTNG